MNLVNAFSASVEKNPQKIALFWGDREYSFTELEEKMLEVSDYLRRAFAVKPGDRVGLWLKNCPEFIPALFGILHAGAVAVPINNFLKPDEVSYILNDAGIDVLLTDADLGAHFHALATERPSLQLFVVQEHSLPAGLTHGTNGRQVNGEDWECMIKQPALDTSHITESDLAVLIYTSGTTGRPKGAMLSHGNLLHNVNSCRLCLRTVEEDRFAVLLPMFHSYMLTVGILLPLLVGGSIVIVKSLHPARNLIQEIFTKRPTILPAFPQFYRSLVNAELPGKLPVRICISGSAPLPGQVLREFESRFQIPLIEGYGLSEASPVVAKNP